MGISYLIEIFAAGFQSKILYSHEFCRCGNSFSSGAYGSVEIPNSGQSYCHLERYRPPIMICLVLK
jgi:hypothetical protein